jgi:hypothetical protein
MGMKINFMRNKKMACEFDIIMKAEELGVSHEDRIRKRRTS